MMTAAIAPMRTKGAKDGQPGMRHECRVVPIECCEMCLLWKDSTIRPFMMVDGRSMPAGVCRRYPEHLVKGGLEWCGEWKSREDIE